MKRLMIGVIVLTVLFGYAAPGARASDTVKIGMVTPLSGPVAYVGRMYVAAVKFAVDEQNAKGGLLGKKIELIVKDDEMKPDVAVRRARSLIVEDKIDILNGAGPSHLVIAVNRVADEFKVININHTGPADIIQGKEFTRYSFRTNHNLYSVTAALAYGMAKKPHERYYLISQDIATGRDSGNAFKQQLKTRLPGAKIVGEDYHPFGTKDFGPYINKIIASKADAIFTSDFGPDLPNLVKQARSFGLKQDIVTVYGGDPYVLNELKDDGIGIYQSYNYSLNVRTPENQKLIAAYHEQHKNDSDFITWWPWGALGQTILGWRMVFAVVEKAKSLDSEKIINTFEGFRYESAVGPWTMRACDHQVIGPQFAGLIEGGPNPYFKFPWEGPKIMMIPGEEVALPATPDYNPRCK